MLTALRAAGSSSSLGTIWRIVAPARVRRGAARSSNPSLTRTIHQPWFGDRQGLSALDDSTLAFGGGLRRNTVYRTGERNRLPSEAEWTNSCLKTLSVGTGPEARPIAVRTRSGAAPGLFWLGGFKSDMRGTKAEALDAWAGRNGRAMVRFDYSGHGESGGTFAEGTIGRWLEESVAVFRDCCTGPQVAIGSSMGGWIALLLARELARQGNDGRPVARGPGADRAGGRLHGRADVEAHAAGDPAADHRDRRLDAAVAPTTRAATRSRAA